MTSDATTGGGTRRDRLEQELASAQAGLARAANAEERQRMEALVAELARKLERLILAIEIERQSDA